MDLVIEGGTVITLNERDEVVPEGTVLVREGRIAGILRKGERKRLPARARRIKAAGRVVLPGLVNAHTHLWQTLIRGLFTHRPMLEWLKAVYGTAKVLRPEDHYHGALVGCLEAIRSGVTCLVEHHFLTHLAESSDALIRGIREVGVRGFLARGFMDAGRLTPRSVMESPRHALRECERLMREYKAELDSGLLGLMVAPNTPGASVSSRGLQEAASFAAAHRLGLSTHVAENRAIVEEVRRQYRAGGVVEYLERLGVLGDRVITAHTVWVQDGEIQTLATRGVHVSHNPVSNMYLGDGVAPVPAMLRAGVNVALGTDGAASNNSQDMFETMKVAALLQRVHHCDPTLMPARQVLGMAIAGGYRAVGLGQEGGCLEPGRLADLIIVDLRREPHTVALHDLVAQLVYCARPGDVRTVVVGGQVVMEEGRILTVDEEAVLAKAQRAGERLVGRIRDAGL
ncbi:MAG: amidohydrolase [Deltaproteobacteria bacterium]|nr:amidohydrolase [Deltaproteobacteria bacterium]MBI3077078.1 amidohydrolase [Deltaproteobacteria bacterium]